MNIIIKEFVSAMDSWTEGSQDIRETAKLLKRLDEPCNEAGSVLLHPEMVETARKLAAHYVCNRNLASVMGEE